MQRAAFLVNAALRLDQINGRAKKYYIQVL